MRDVADLAGWRTRWQPGAIRRNQQPWTGLRRWSGPNSLNSCLYCAGSTNTGFTITSTPNARVPDLPAAGRLQDVIHGALENMFAAQAWSDVIAGATGAMGVGDLDHSTAAAWGTGAGGLVIYLCVNH